MVMTDGDANLRSVLRFVMYLQLVVSVLFVIGGVAFPIYTVLRHGFSELPIYDGSGHVIGTASYFLLSVVGGLLMIGLGTLCAWLARRALRQI